jgi:A/G-specific adenine glycosylase
LPDDLAAYVPDSAWRQQLRRRVAKWYAEHKRDLPWRRDRDPYKIWISETMLQQTTVAAVVPYFERFLKAFPTVADLANASEADVMRQWEGLGYYRRARFLHAAAKKIVAEHGGVFPTEPDDVAALPGVGRYTAGAILSIAFDRRAPILEANTLRLYSRLIAYPGDPRSTPGQQLLWHVAEDWLPNKEVGAFNQALMEIGGQVCSPRDPRCLICPLASLCRARAAGLQDTIPPLATRPTPTDVREVAIIIERGDTVLLQHNAANAPRWAGLWDFVRFPVELAASEAVRWSELIAEVERRTGLAIEPGTALTTIRHGVTRFRITLDCFTATPTSATSQPKLNPDLPEIADLRWVPLADLSTYPLSTSGRKIAGRVGGGAER